MNPTIWKTGAGALLICLGLGACDQQRTGAEGAQAPYEDPTTTAPATDPATDMGATTSAEPYATAPADAEIDAMTGSTDLSGTETIGDTSGDRCAGLAGQALTDCLEMESVRQQEQTDPELMEDDLTP